MRINSFYRQNFYAMYQILNQYFNIKHMISQNIEVCMIKWHNYSLYCIVVILIYFIELHISFNYSSYYNSWLVYVTLTEVIWQRHEKRLFHYSTFLKATYQVEVLHRHLPLVSCIYYATSGKWCWNPSISCLQKVIYF